MKTPKTILVIILASLISPWSFASLQNDLGTEVDPSVLAQVEGYYRFEREDFRRRHPLMLGFMVNKALRTRLHITGDHYIQYITPDKLYKDRREVLEVSPTSEQTGWRFVRLESGRQISYTMTPQGQNRWLYKEGDKEYLLIKCSDQEVADWKNAGK